MNKNTPLNAIKAKFLDCCVGSLSEVRKCTISDCPLHPFRFGKRRKPNSEERHFANSVA